MVEHESLWQAFLPGLLILLLGIGVLPMVPRGDRTMRIAGALLSVALILRYVIWRWAETMPAPGFTADFAVGLIFAVIETATLFGTCVNLVFLTRTLDRSREADLHLPWLQRQPVAPLVDVLICTYNENADILERTMIGAVSMNYPNFRVWVCDDGKRDWLRAMAEKLGCRYLTRDGNAHAKAGNINAALDHLAGLETPPAFIAILDADFVTKANFLTRTMALMHDPKVGIVQTPQHFINPDPIQVNLALGDVWPDEQRFFFDILLPAKDAWNAAFCCGTSSLIRFAPLCQIGGFPTDSLTEDYLLSLRLRETGFNTIFLNEQLSLGLAPEGLREYIVQRSRWSLGFVQIIRGRSGPFSLNSTLPLIDRISLIDSFLYWSSTFLFRIASMIVPALYLLCGVQSVSTDLEAAISHVLPMFMVQIVYFGWMTSGRILPMMSDASQLLCAVEILGSVATGLFKPQGHKFKVTAKGGDRSQRMVQWRKLSVFGALLLLNMLGIIYRFDIDDGTILPAAGLALFWSYYNIGILLLASFVCVEQSQPRQSERFSVQEHVTLSWNGEESHALATDISLSGMRCRAPALAIGTGLKVRFANCELDAQVTRETSDGFALRFNDDIATKVQLIRFIYSGRHKTGISDVEPARVGKAILARLFR